jgi:hypothetical protein
MWPINQINIAIVSHINIKYPYVNSLFNHQNLKIMDSILHGDGSEPWFFPFQFCEVGGLLQSWTREMRQISLEVR